MVRAHLSSRPACALRCRQKADLRGRTRPASPPAAGTFHCRQALRMPQLQQQRPRRPPRQRAPAVLEAVTRHVRKQITSAATEAGHRVWARASLKRSKRQQQHRGQRGKGKQSSSRGGSQVSHESCGAARCVGAAGHAGLGCQGQGCLGDRERAGRRTSACAACLTAPAGRRRAAAPRCCCCPPAPCPPPRPPPRRHQARRQPAAKHTRGCV